MTDTFCIKVPQTLRPGLLKCQVHGCNNDPTSMHSFPGNDYGEGLILWYCDEHHVYYLEHSDEIPF